MIVIISATNRKGSNTLKIAKYYQEALATMGTEAPIFDLSQLDSVHRNATFDALEKAYLIPATKYIIISPEYNGSFSGILKLMIDHSDMKTCFWGKKVALVGVSTGRAGNLRGLDHLTNILNYIKVQVLPNKLPISVIHTLLQEQTNTLNHEPTIAAIQAQLTEFMAY